MSSSIYPNPDQELEVFSRELQRCPLFSSSLWDHDTAVACISFAEQWAKEVVVCREEFYYLTPVHFCVQRFCEHGRAKIDDIGITLFLNSKNTRVRGILQESRWDVDCRTGNMRSGSGVFYNVSRGNILVGTPNLPELVRAHFIAWGKGMGR